MELVYNNHIIGGFSLISTKTLLELFAKTVWNTSRGTVFRFKSAIYLKRFYTHPPLNLLAGY